MSKKSHRVYCIISYVLACTVMAYIGISQWIINTGLYKTQELSFFTGQLLLATTNPMRLTLNNPVKTLEFQFSSTINSAEMSSIQLTSVRGANTTSSEFQVHQLSQPEQQWLAVTLNEDSLKKAQKFQQNTLTIMQQRLNRMKTSLIKQKNSLTHQRSSNRTEQEKILSNASLENKIIKAESNIARYESLIDINKQHFATRKKSLAIEFNKESTESPAPMYFVKKILLNGIPVNLNDFHENFISRKNNSFRYYIPTQFQNLSRSLAVYLGPKLTMLIQFVLLSALAIQLLLIMISSFWQPPGLADYFDNPESNPPLSFVDQYCNNYAIALGFLGTVLSIWIALESDMSAFNDFDSVLSIFKVAIFTTVLGLCVKMLCTFRSSRLSFIKPNVQDIQHGP